MKTFVMLAAASLASLLLTAGAEANVGQEQACAGDVSQMQDIPMSEIRVVHANGSHSGVTEVVLEYPGGMARCRVDKEYNILDIRWNHATGHSHAKAQASSKSGQEQACAARLAQEVNVEMSAVRVKSSKPTKHGHLTVTVTTPGMNARCNVDANYNVVGFKFLGY